MVPFTSFILFFLGCLIGLPLVEGTSVRSSCPPGWFFYRSHCYGYIRQKKPWAEAEFECHSYGHGAHLTSILDDAEASIVASSISAYQTKIGVWVGLHDPEKNQRWKWNDGSLYNYKAWKKRESINSEKGGHCVVLTSGSGFKKWKGSACDAGKHFLCKYKP
ncbi:regenerating islet-derived protein 4-like [Rhinatrema bivittatum]|uniref:regenerating islet-derived protein 4-like n=1 Tax=Rhinatrema bivittatum TaxID=194408 RepID=UPI00112ADA4F|nr:regenerating islet-derived protein 4-like [Rhinatrema bivittatum]XP_029472022.1 regenerating islet-derived protein 4-like [Rhinatrema bivittatum]